MKLTEKIKKMFAKKDYFALTDIEKDILRSIGWIIFDLNVHPSDAQTDKITEAKLLSFGIHFLKYDEKKSEVTIYLSRPGLLIGKRGMLINSINIELDERFKKHIIINLKEYGLNDYLFSYQSAYDLY